jgi:hypothetical protein
LQTRVVKAIKALKPGAYVFHPVGGPYQMPGIPDLLLSVDGLFIGMELKQPKPGESVEHARSRATPQQRNQIRKINESGGIAGVVTSVEEALDLIHRAKVKHRGTESDEVGA